MLKKLFICSLFIIIVPANPALAIKFDKEMLLSPQDVPATYTVDVKEHSISFDLTRIQPSEADLEARFKKELPRKLEILDFINDFIKQK